MKNVFTLSMLFCLAILSGCGGSGGGAAIVELNVDTRMNALNTVDTAASTMTFDNFATTGPALVATIKAMPEFSDAGITDGDQTVWATFTDGRILYINANRKPTGKGFSTAKQSRGLGSDLPSTTDNVAYYSFGGGFKNTAVVILPWLLDRAYTGPSTFGTGTVEQWRGLNGQSDVYVDTHGARPKGTRPFAMMTSTPVTKANDLLYADDLRAQRLVYFSGKYAITPNFVRTYIKLAPNSFVFLNCCNSFADSTMYAAFTAAGAGVYAGWTDNVEDSIAFDTGQFVYDRLLGNNAMPPVPSPKLNPESWAQVASDITTVVNPHSSEPYNLSPSTGAILKIQSGAGTLGTITPAITAVYGSQPSNTYAIQGTFGSTKGHVFGQTGSQTVELTVSQWTSTSITTNYDGTVNSLYVVAGGLLSNDFAVPSSTWKLTGPSGGVFSAKTEIIVTKNGQTLLDAMGDNIPVLSFSAKANELIHVTLKTTQTFGGSSDLYIQPPTGAAYRVIAGATDLIPNSSGVVDSEDILLYQP